MLRIKGDAYTFDDLLLVPRHTTVLPHEVDTTAMVTRSISTHLPLLSAAMDTVTESTMAIAIAKAGGLGIVHRNMDIEKQCEEVRRVKKHEGFCVSQPITIHQEATLHELCELMHNHGVSGVPVTAHKESRKLVGIVTARDMLLRNESTLLVQDIMVSREKLVTAPPSITQQEARRRMVEHRIEKLPIVDEHGSLHGIMTLKDIHRETKYPHATRDASGQLRVGAAIGITEHALDDASALLDAGADILVIDTAHGHAQRVLDTIRMCRTRFTDAQLLGGNVATGEAACAVAGAGADGVKVGIGPGTICTTRVVTGVGVPQVSAIAEVAHALQTSHPHVTVVADGGIQFSGDIAKAIAAGAHTVMMGSIFAGTDEAPGEQVLHEGRVYKRYRGMGSVGAMRDGSRDRYFQHEKHGDRLVPEGVEGMVLDRGPVQEVVEQMVGGLRAAMGYVGCNTIAAMRSEPMFVRVTNAGVREGHVHDVHVTHEPPNYRRSL